MEQKVYTFCFNFLPQGLHLLPHKVIVYHVSQGGGQLRRHHGYDRGQWGPHQRIFILIILSYIQELKLKVNQLSTAFHQIAAK